MFVNNIYIFVNNSYNRGMNQQKEHIPMIKSTFKCEFSSRLRELMAREGHISHNSTTGVSPSALCKAIGTSTTMALRFLNNEAIPSPEQILTLSKWLKVNPGYLLFGTSNDPINNDIIKINKDLLEYALSNFVPLIKNVKNQEELVQFLVSILLDLSQMNMSDIDLKKVLDFTIKSTNILGNKQLYGSTGHENIKSKKIVNSITS